MRYVWQTLLFISVIHAVAIYLFITGFFLTRYELKHRSTCDQLSSENGTRSFTSSDPSPLCTKKPTFSKSIIVLIDALRFDFADFNETLAEVRGVPKFFQNKLPVLHSKLYEQPSRSRLFRFVADAPTVTMQRLKGMTTGGLPTFIDIGNNFDTSKIDEDNWLFQIKSMGKKIVFMGDDTWVQLFSPDSFYRLFPFESFNVKDLHLVDNGCLEHLFPTLEGDPAEWDVVIAHFLGVDHAGHRYGPSHEAMKDKLNQMNGVLSDLMRWIDKNHDDDTSNQHTNSSHNNHVNKKKEDVVLFVFGDHGMTPEGNHGGSHELETDAAFFVYSSKDIFSPFPIFEKNDHRLTHAAFHAAATAEQQQQQQQSSSQSHVHPTASASSSSALSQQLQSTLFDFGFVPSRENVNIASGECAKISQIDFVPTLSFLLGAPIPFGSLGQLIPELFMPPLNTHFKQLLSSSSSSSSSAPLSSLFDLWSRTYQLFYLSRHLHLNSLQVWKYMREYSHQAQTFSADDLARMNALLNKATSHADALLASSDRVGVCLVKGFHNDTHNIIDDDDDDERQKKAVQWWLSCLLEDQSLSHSETNTSTTEYITLAAALHQSVQSYYTLCTEYQTFLSEAASLARQKWTSFRPAYMIIGIALLCLASFVAMPLYLYATSTSDFHTTTLSPSLSKTEKLANNHHAPLYGALIGAACGLLLCFLFAVVALVSFDVIPLPRAHSSADAPSSAAGSSPPFSLPQKCQWDSSLSFFLSFFSGCICIGTHFRQMVQALWVYLWSSFTLVSNSSSSSSMLEPNSSNLSLLSRSDPPISIEDACLFIVALCSLLGFIFVSLRSACQKYQVTRSSSSSSSFVSSCSFISRCVAILLVIVYLQGLFSNSFIILEHRVTQFLLVLGWLLYVCIQLVSFLYARNTNDGHNNNSNTPSSSSSLNTDNSTHHLQRPLSVAFFCALLFVFCVRIMCWWCGGAFLISDEMAVLEGTPSIELLRSSYPSTFSLSSLLSSFPFSAFSFLLVDIPYRFFSFLLSLIHSIGLSLLSVMAFSFSFIMRLFSDGHILLSPSSSSATLLSPIGSPPTNSNAPDAVISSEYFSLTDRLIIFVVIFLLPYVLHSILLFFVCNCPSSSFLSSPSSSPSPSSSSIFSRLSTVHVYSRWWFFYSIVRVVLSLLCVYFLFFIGVQVFELTVAAVVIYICVLLFLWRFIIASSSTPLHPHCSFPLKLHFMRRFLLLITILLFLYWIIPIESVHSSSVGGGVSFGNNNNISNSNNNNSDSSSASFSTASQPSSLSASTSLLSYLFSYFSSFLRTFALLLSDRSYACSYLFPFLHSSYPSPSSSSSFSSFVDLLSAPFVFHFSSLSFAQCCASTYAWICRQSKHYLPQLVYFFSLLFFICYCQMNDNDNSIDIVDDGDDNQQQHRHTLEKEKSGDQHKSNMFSHRSSLLSQTTTTTAAATTTDQSLDSNSDDELLRLRHRIGQPLSSDSSSASQQQQQQQQRKSINTASTTTRDESEQSISFFIRLVTYSDRLWLHYEHLVNTILCYSTSLFPLLLRVSRSVLLYICSLECVLTVRPLSVSSETVGDIRIFSSFSSSSSSSCCFSPSIPVTIRPTNLSSSTIPLSSSSHISHMNSKQCSPEPSVLCCVCVPVPSSSSSSLPLSSPSSLLSSSSSSLPHSTPIITIIDSLFPWRRVVPSRMSPCFSTNSFLLNLCAAFYLIFFPFLLLQGPKAPLYFVLMALAVYSFVIFAWEQPRLLSTSSAPPTTQTQTSLSSNSVFSVHLHFMEIVLLFFFSIYLFFVTAHKTEFSSLQVSCVFIGFEEFSFWRSVWMLGTNTFVGQLWVIAFALPLLAAFRIMHRTSAPSTSESSDSSSSSVVVRRRNLSTFTRTYLNTLFSMYWTFMCLYAIRGCISTINVTIQRRHLMVWSVFAPKFLFDALSFLVVDIVCLVFWIFLSLLLRPRTFPRSESELD